MKIRTELKNENLKSATNGMSMIGFDNVKCIDWKHFIKNARPKLINKKF